MPTPQLQNYRDSPIYVDDSTSVSMDHIRSSARLLKSRNQCDAIIIDYLQLCDMATKQANRNREQEVAQATRKAVAGQGAAYSRHTA